jgi:hypothetical protein
MSPLFVIRVTRTSAGQIDYLRVVAIAEVHLGSRSGGYGSRDNLQGVVSGYPLTAEKAHGFMAVACPR